MRRPSGHARDREDWRERLPRNGERVEQDRGEEFHIGVERTVRIFPPERVANIGLDFAREWKGGPVAREPLDRGLEHVRARIADPIDAVAETHQPFATRERAVAPRLVPRPPPGAPNNF